MLVIGAGVVGLAAAWLLQRQGHRVQLLDPSLDPGLQGPATADSGSRAALGVLMAEVFNRSSGRGWRLRQRSLELWRQWVDLLEAEGHRLPRRPGLLLLASNGEEWDQQQRLVGQRQSQGIALELWPRQRLNDLQPALPATALGALYSPNDGQIDPGPVLEALLTSASKLGLQTSALRANGLERQGSHWLVHCATGDVFKADWVVLSAGVASSALLEPLGHRIAIEPVLGQAVELECGGIEPGKAWGQWPGAVVWKGINLVPRPFSSEGAARLWVGATLERSEQPDPAELERLCQLAGDAPPWLRQAKLVRQWQGVRPRPVGQPAPLLQMLEPRLLLASGHYRNGVLLAPASAEWVRDQITSIR